MRQRLLIGGIAGLAAGLVLGFPPARAISAEVYHRTFGTPYEWLATEVGFAVNFSFGIFGAAVAAGVAYLTRRRPPGEDSP